MNTFNFDLKKINEKKNNISLFHDFNQFHEEGT